MNPPRFDITKSFLLSAGSVVVIVLVLLSTLPNFLGAVFSTSTDSMDVTSSLEDLIGEHEEMMTLYQARFNGREVFFTPPPTPKPLAPRPIKKPPRDPVTKPPIPSTPRTPTPPPNYSGPTILAIVGNQVWFAGASFQAEIMRIRVGEEQNNLKVLATTPPWSARVSYQRGEYDVKLFDRDGFKFEELKSDTALPEGMTMKEVKPESSEPTTGEKNPEGSDKQDQEPASTEDPPKSGSKDAEKDNTAPAGTGNATSDDPSQSRDKTKEAGSEKTSGGVTSNVGASESDA